MQEVIDSEWALNNFSVKQMILSLINAPLLKGSYTGHQLQEYLEKTYQEWKGAILN